MKSAADLINDVNIEEAAIIQSNFMSIVRHSRNQIQQRREQIENLEAVIKLHEEALAEATKMWDAQPEHTQTSVLRIREAADKIVGKSRHA